MIFSFPTSFNPLLLATRQDLEIGFFPLTLTLQAFVLQVLSADKSCKQILCRILAERLQQHLPSNSLNTSNYVRARKRLPEEIVHALREVIAENEESKATCSWNGRHVYLLDGTTVTMPDTKENQAIWPQHPSQKQGLGFPILRLVGMISLNTGCMVDYSIGPFEGCSELKLGRELLKKRQAGDVIVADRLWDNFWFWSYLKGSGLEGVARQGVSRKFNLKHAKKIGNHDYLVKVKSQHWSQLLSRSWQITHEEFDDLPQEVPLRRVEVEVKRPGFRAEKLILLTTLLEASKEELAEIYLQRWAIEGTSDTSKRS